jgi:rRNA maturation endonuclease Nob1
MMTCLKCTEEFEGVDSSFCPRCGSGDVAPTEADEDEDEGEG